MAKLSKEEINRFIDAFSMLVLKMQEVDNTCVLLTQDITKSELALISQVGDEQYLIMRDIANFLEIPLSTATGVVDKLVQKEYLTRYHSEEDRRAVRVTLGAKGEEAYQLFNRTKSKMGSNMLEDLEAEERDALIGLLEKMTQNLGKRVVRKTAS